MSGLKPHPNRSTVRLLIVCSVLLSQPLVGQVEMAPELINPAPPELCALLDDPKLRAMMDGLLFNLIWSCGREDEFLGHGPGGGSHTGAEKIVQKRRPVPVNYRFQEVHPSATQNETSLAEDAANGILCAAFNDSWEFINGRGFTGFSRSIDGGSTWLDGGAVGPTAFGDPSLAWRQADGKFFLATLEQGSGLSLWESNDGCQSFRKVRRVTGLLADDKEFLAVDNDPASPNYGNLYLVWTRFEATPSIYASRSRWVDGALAWSAPVRLGRAGPSALVQGAWPAVAPNGDVYVAWMSIENFPNGALAIQVARSTDGGLTWLLRASPLLGAITPRDQAATNLCGFPALKGNVRILPSPQLGIDGQGRLHLVYSRAPDAPDAGDNADVYYRRSSDGALTWGPEIRLNDDTTTNDQYHPTVAVNGNTVMATWYDRRQDPDNLALDYFKRFSTDGGVTWFPNIQVSSAAAGITFDPVLAPCYYGDYDQSLIASDRNQIALWSDDRHGDPDVFAQTSRCLRGELSGPWKLPLTPQVVTGKVTEPAPGSRPLYSIQGQALPDGQINGTWTGIVPDYTPLIFSGRWSAIPPQGGWTAQLQSATVPGIVIGTINATWNAPGPGGLSSSRFTGTWEICLP